MFNEKYGAWAIVAGAAEGLGEAYSTALAKRRINLLMIDVQEQPMQDLGAKLMDMYGIEINYLHLDLALENAFELIMKASENLDVGLLIYNAAYSLIKPFTDHTPEELDRFIELNTRTQIKLVHAFSIKLIEQKKPGGILLMSSLTGLLGMQLVAPYSATKAFTWNLAEALHYELIEYRIDIMACVAGLTATPALLNSNPKFGYLRSMVMKPDEVAESALKKLGQKTVYIPGLFNRLNYFILTRLMPRKIAVKISNKTMQKMYAGAIIRDAS